jgi:hypothetical protein
VKSESQSARLPAGAIFKSAVLADGKSNPDAPACSTRAAMSIQKSWATKPNRPPAAMRAVAVQKMTFTPKRCSKRAPKAIMVAPMMVKAKMTQFAMETGTWKVLDTSGKVTDMRVIMKPLQNMVETITMVMARASPGERLGFCC